MGLVLPDPDQLGAGLDAARRSGRAGDRSGSGRLRHLTQILAGGGLEAAQGVAWIRQAIDRMRIFRRTVLGAIVP